MPKSERLEEIHRRESQAAKAGLFLYVEHRGLHAQKIGRLWKLKPSDVDASVSAGGVDSEGSPEGKH